MCAVGEAGGLFFGSFLLAGQKKATQGAGAELPAISFMSIARTTRDSI